jgi:hypothetical protein
MDGDRDIRAVSEETESADGSVMRLPHGNTDPAALFFTGRGVAPASIPD